MSFNNKRSKQKIKKKGCLANGLHHDKCNGQATEIHHIRPISYGGSHDDSNLLPVNRWCHKLIHAPWKEDKAVELGLLIVEVDPNILSAYEIDMAILKRHRETD